MHQKKKKTKEKLCTLKVFLLTNYIDIIYINNILI